VPIFNLNRVVISINQTENDPMSESIASEPISPEPSRSKELEIVLCCTKCGLQFRKILLLESIAELRCSHCEQLLSTLVPISGIVYVLSNPSMPGIVKIGQTSRKIDERLRELSASSGVPQPFSREALFSSVNPIKDEQKIHNNLSVARVSDNREFFRLSPKDAVDAIRKILGRSPFAGLGDDADNFAEFWRPKIESPLSR
jgi:hypothetical protein